MTRVYAAHITGPDGELTPRNVTVSNARFASDFPKVMPLPRWEPTWEAVEAIDRTLDDGQNFDKHPDHCGWQDEPSAENLAHVAAHVVKAMDMWAFGKEYTPEFVEEIEHAITRLAMELTNLGRRMQTQQQASPDQSSQGAS